jgi:hypothetical protein
MNQRVVCPLWVYHQLRMPMLASNTSSLGWTSLSNTLVMLYLEVKTEAFNLVGCNPPLFLLTI